MRRVVFVDDAPEILNHLQRTLAPMQAEWAMEFHPSATAALTAIRETPCDVVVSDMTMPGMDGAQFLGEVRKVCPQAIRIVLSGDQTPANYCLLYTSPSPRDRTRSRMPPSASTKN